MKLVVTGHDAKRNSIFSHAGPPPRQPSSGTYELWSTQGPIVMPDPKDAQSPASIGCFPKEGESAWKTVSVPGLAARAQMGSAAMAIPDELRSHLPPTSQGDPDGVSGGEENPASCPPRAGRASQAPASPRLRAPGP